MELDWLTLLIPLLGHVLYGIPPDPSCPGTGVRLHNGDDFSDTDEPPHPERLLNVRAVTASGIAPVPVSGNRETGVALETSGVTDRPCWIVVETPGTFIEIRPDGFHRYLEHEGLSGVIGARETAGQRQQPGREIYSKYVKIALSDSDGAVRLLESPVGLPIEIVPQVPGPLRTGDTLPVRVLVNGQPAPDLQLRVSHRASEKSEPSEDIVMRTDRGGRAAVAIPQAGLWRLHTISMSPHPDPAAADWESIWASVTFRVA